MLLRTLLSLAVFSLGLSCSDKGAQDDKQVEGLNPSTEQAVVSPKNEEKIRRQALKELPQTLLFRVKLDAKGQPDYATAEYRFAGKKSGGADQSLADQFQNGSQVDALASDKVSDDFDGDANSTESFFHHLGYLDHAYSNYHQNYYNEGHWSNGCNQGGYQYEYVSTTWGCQRPLMFGQPAYAGSHWGCKWFKGYFCKSTPVPYVAYGANNGQALPYGYSPNQMWQDGGYGYIGFQPMPMPYYNSGAYQNNFVDPYGPNQFQGGFDANSGYYQGGFQQNNNSVYPTIY